MLQAYAYRRVSSDRQKGNSSFNRQDDDVEAFCEEERWPIIDTISDDGVSASTGANITTGSLADFIRECEIEGGSGKVLVMETQDRLSRLHEVDFFEWFIKVLRTGLTVAFADNRMIVDSSSFRNQKRQMRRMIDDAEEAHSYIEKLGRRVRRAWQTMRDDGLPVHCSPKKENGKGTCPEWLEMSPDRKRFLQPEESSSIVHYRIALINEMFDLHIGGMGFAAMERLLNARGEPTWRGGKGWRKSSIKRIINGRQVLGEYQHKVKRVPVGDPDPDYFPQVVSNEKWLAANSRSHKRVMASHAHESKLTNLLSDVARCTECGGRMLFRNKARKANGEPVAYLQCDSAARSMGCSSRKMVRYYPLERQVLDALLTRALDDQHFQKDDEVASIKRKMADQRRVIDDIQVRISNCVESIERFSDKPSLMAQFEIRLRTADADLDTASKAIGALEAQLERARGRASRSQHVKRVSEIRAELRSEDKANRDAAGLLVKAALNDLIETLHVSNGHPAPVEGLAGVLARHMPHTAVAVLTGGIGVAFFGDGAEPQLFELIKRQGSLDHLPEGTRRVVDGYLKRVGGS